MSNPSNEPEKPPIRLWIVAADNRLVREIRAVDAERRFEPVRTRHFDRACEKAASIPGSSLLVQWTVEEILRQLTVSSVVPPLSRKLPCFIFCPEFPKLAVARGEALRFALLEFGAAAVFSRMRMLPRFLEIIRRRAERFPLPEKSLFQEIEESLPWKNDASGGWSPTASFL